MADISTDMRQLNTFEELALGNSFVHKLHPAAKLVVSLVFIIAVVSADRYDFAALLPFFGYVIIIGAIADVPVGLVFKRALWAVPFCFFAGVSNIIFETQTALALGNFTISFGVLSFITLLIKSLLTVWAVMLLSATTKVTDIVYCLLKIKIPEIIVMQFFMTYRYLSVISTEAASMVKGYRLRSNSRGVDIRHTGSFLGQLMLRSFDRAERVFTAMKCYGYTGDVCYGITKKFMYSDFWYIFLISLGIVLLRIFNISYYLGGLL